MQELFAVHHEERAVLIPIVGLVGKHGRCKVVLGRNDVGRRDGDVHQSLLVRPSGRLKCTAGPGTLGRPPSLDNSHIVVAVGAYAVRQRGQEWHIAAAARGGRRGRITVHHAAGNVAIKGTGEVVGAQSPVTSRGTIGEIPSRLIAKALQPRDRYGRRRHYQD